MPGLDKALLDKLLWMSTDKPGGHVFNDEIALITGQPSKTPPKVQTDLFPPQQYMIDYCDVIPGKPFSVPEGWALYKVLKMADNGGLSLFLTLLLVRDF